MRLYSRYLGTFYIKYVIILFIALECFYVGVDLLTNLKDLPKSANLALLYLGMTAASAVSYVLPLSLVFALIITKFNMIRSNELVSFYALGISKNRLIVAPFFISLLISAAFIGLNCTPFSYASEYKKNLSNFAQIGRISKDMFLKFEGKYIYIHSLNPIDATARDIKIYSFSDENMLSRIEATSASYNSNIWTLNDANVTILPIKLRFGAQGYSQSHEKTLKELKKFNPKTIENVYQSGNAYSIIDAVRAIRAFKNQGVNISTIKSSLYTLIFFPLFAPLMLLILYYYLPTTGRFGSLALSSFIFFIVTLCVWGVLFVLIRFSLNGVILPEIGIIMPILLLCIFSIYLFSKNR